MHLYYLAPTKYYNKTLSDNVLMLLQLVSRFNIDKLVAVMCGDNVMLIPYSNGKHIDQRYRVRMPSYKLLSEYYLADRVTDVSEFFAGFTIYFTPKFALAAQIDDLMLLCGLEPRAAKTTVKQIDQTYRGDFPTFSIALLGDSSDPSSLYIFLDTLAAYINKNIHLASGLHGLQFADSAVTMGFLDQTEYESFVELYATAYNVGLKTPVQSIPVEEKNSLLLRYELSKKNITSYYYNGFVYYLSEKPIKIAHDYAELVKFISSCDPNFDIISLEKFSELNNDDLLDIIQFEDQVCTIVDPNDNLERLATLFKARPFSLRTTTKLTEIDLLRISLYRASYIGLVDYYFSSGVNHVMIPGKITLELVVVNSSEDLSINVPLAYYEAVDRTSIWAEEEILEIALLITPKQRKIIDAAWRKGKLLSNYARAYWRHYGKLVTAAVGTDSFIFTANASKSSAERVLQYLS